MIITTRSMVIIIFPLFVTFKAYRKKSVNLSGAIIGCLMTYILSFASYCFLFDMFTFFVTSSMATKYKQDQKSQIEENFKEGGQRGWVQAVCNCGVATILAFLYLSIIGSDERPIDFLNDATSSWLSVAIMSVFAFGNADTWASELGTVIAKSDPYLITTWKKVPTGTNGGITLAGTVLSALGGFAVGLTHYIGMILFVDSETMVLEAQWLVIIYGMLAGLFGSLLDSFFGATLQFSGISKNGKIVSNPEMAVQYISGTNILSNHNVNLATNIIISVAIPTLAKMLSYSYFTLF